MVHAFKPNPRTEKQEWKRILDFLSFHPESMHMLTFLLDDVGVPAAYQNMPGFGVHTFELLSAAGARTFVKFHWLPEQPVESLADAADAARVCGADFSHATHALVDAIDAGDFPAWRLAVQTMDPDDADAQKWGDPLDATKTWPEDLFPLREVGRMVLDRNVDNQFLENEQIAFSPGVVVPGIGYSCDKLLQGRLFSYADAQRYRLGSNYQQLPVNAPRCPFANMHHDGALNHMHRQAEENYFPSTRQPLRQASGVPPLPARTEVAAAAAPTRQVIGRENNFAQAGERFRSFDAARQERFVARVVDTLSEPGMSKQLKTTWLGYWTQCDRSLGARVAAKVKLSSM